jgi:hypothetical protein
MNHSLAFFALLLLALNSCTNGTKVSSTASAFKGGTPLAANDTVPDPNIEALEATLGMASYTIAPSADTSQQELTVTLTYQGNTPAKSVAIVTDPQTTSFFSFKGESYPGVGATCTPEISNTCTLKVIIASALLTYQRTLTLSYDGGAGEIKIITLSISSLNRDTKNPNAMLSSFDVGRHFVSILGNRSSRTSTLLIFKTGEFPATQMTAQNLSAPFSYKGGVYPGAGGSCGQELATASCTIVIEYNPTATAVTTSQLVLNYFNGASSQSLAIPLSGRAFRPDALKNVLVVYNENSTSSKKVRDYYLQKRFGFDVPGFAAENTLGLFTSEFEIISMANFSLQIRSPILNWIAANPQKKIYYIILLHGLPSRVDGTGSVQYLLSRTLENGSYRVGFEYRNSNMSFANEEFTGSAALVTHLAMGSEEATLAYIDKLHEMASQMANPGLVISAQNAAQGGSSYYFDDSGRIYPQYIPGSLASQAVLRANPTASVNYQASSHVLGLANVSGFLSWGTHGGLPVGVNDSVYGYNPTYGMRFDGKSNWFLMETIESWNGVANSGQGNFALWFSARAFASSMNHVPYSSTPVGAVTHVEEPTIAGVNGPNYFALWEQGYLFIEAAWASRNTPYFMAVGDPLITK